MKLKSIKSEYSSPIIPLEECLAKTTSEGKPGCTVLEHCIYVGVIAQALWTRLTPDIQSLLPEKIVVLLAAFHDIGKISPGFAQKIFLAVKEKWPDEVQPVWREILESNVPWEKNHTKTGQIALIDTDLAKWSRVVGMHHGNIDITIEYAESTCADTLGGETWQELRMNAVRQLTEYFGPIPTDVPVPSKLQIQMATALIVIADWLGSDEHFLIDRNVLQRKYLSKRANDILDEIGWFVPKSIADRSFDDLFSENANDKWEPNEMQTAFHEVATTPGLYVIEAPMGMGKTEAALWGAYQLIHNGFHHGIYFALPTRTTSDKIHERFEPFLDRSFQKHNEAGLVHGNAWMKYFNNNQINSDKKKQNQDSEENKNALCGASWFLPKKRALLQSFGVGTIDQSLLGVLPVRHAFLRLFGLAGKVVVFDEVHSYDLYTGTLLDKTICELVELGATVIILSATLTQSRRELLFRTNSTLHDGDYMDNDCIPQIMDCNKDQQPYPLITWRYHSGQTGYVVVPPPKSRTIHLEHVDWELAQVARNVVEAAESGQMVLCVMNTIDKAQILYRLVQGQSSAKISTNRIGLLHGRFPKYRRDAIEKKWLNVFGKYGDRSQGAILISTQVVEQSVDLDADLLITELAPTDMILQRLGRLWRHLHKDRKATVPRVIILYPPVGDEPFEHRLGANAFVYAPYILWRSAEQWRMRATIEIPCDIRTLLESTYLKRDETGEAGMMYFAMLKKAEKMKDRAYGVTSGGLIEIPDTNTVATRYNDCSSITLLLLKHMEYNPKRQSEIIITLSSGVRIPIGYAPVKIDDMIKLHENTVTIREKKSDKAWQALATQSGIVYNAVNQYFYDKVVPLLLDLETGRLLTSKNEETPLFYSDELGLFREQRTVNNQPELYTKNDIQEDDDEWHEDFEW